MPPELMDPFTVLIDLENGTMPEHTNYLRRNASDMRGHYADSDALANLINEGNDPLHYEVFETPVPEKIGQLMYCISRLQPGKVGDEFFMTKGHYHTVEDTAEIYLCLKGTGYMLMKTADGKWAAEQMSRGRMIYVPPFWAHRSVNTSADEPLVSFCVYPGNAGHNYGDIEQQGFPKRIFERDGRAVIE
ncbi:MAG: glucose-6-phosphate isomerase family protein [Planctomycetota bacterium]